MTIQDFAEKLNGRQYLKEMTKEEEKLARKLGFVVVFGYSDDITEFRGAISDEAGSYGGRVIYLDQNDLLFNKCDNNDCPYFEERKKDCHIIVAVWGSEGYSWTYKTDVPHATFDVFDGGEKYCRGIVFDIQSLK